MPCFSDSEISDLVNLNMDMVRPPDPGLSFEKWSNAWNTALRSGIRAVGGCERDAVSTYFGAGAGQCPEHVFFLLAERS